MRGCTGHARAQLAPAADRAHRGGGRSAAWANSARAWPVQPRMPAPRRGKAPAPLAKCLPRCARAHYESRLASRPLYYNAVNAPSKFGAHADAQFSRSGVAMPKMSRWRQMQVPIVAWAVYWLLRAIGPTLRVEIVGVHNAAQFRDSGEPAIGAFWHRCIFPAAWIWKNRGIVVLNTVNFDGQWTRRVIERLGFGTAQGSSNRGAIEGLS